jgi:hemolysin activation/secretion protein
MIFEGERKGHWQFKKPEAPKVEAPKVEAPKVEAPKEEKKDVVVQQNTQPKESAKTEALPPEPNVRQNDESTAPTAEKEKTATVKVDTFIRETEHSGSPAVSVVTKGSSIDVLEVKGRVARVSLKGEKSNVQGWMLLEFIDKP